MILLQKLKIIIIIITHYYYDYYHQYQFFTEIFSVNPLNLYYK